MTQIVNAMYEPLDWVLPRGGDVVLEFVVREPLPSTARKPMTGRTVVFVAAGRGFRIERTITSFGTDEGVACVVAVTLTRADLRRLSAEPTPYELEDRYGGTELPFAGGNLFGDGGVNLDQ